MSLEWLIFFLASAGWVVAVLEFIQLYLQRKVLQRIEKTLSTIDVEQTITTMTENTTRVVEDLKNSLLELVDKLPSAFAESIEKFAASIDVQTIIDHLTAQMVNQLVEAAPAIVTTAADQVKQEAGGFMFDDETIKTMDEHPIGTLLSLATMAGAARRAQGPKEQLARAPSGRRQI